MTAETLMMIYCGLLVAILVLGFLGGMVHGRRKAIFKLVTTAIFYVVFFLTIDLVATKMLDAPILMQLEKWGIVLPPEIAGCASIKDACTKYLIEMELTPDEIIPIIMSFSIVVTKIVYTLLYFIIIGMVYCLLVNIIYYCFFWRRKARIKKLKSKQDNKVKTMMDRPNNKEPKLKEHRLMGGLLGFVKKIPQVIVVIAVTTGIISLIPSITPSEDGKQDLSTNIQSDELMDLIEKNNLQEYVKFVEMYRNSAFVKVLGGGVGSNDKKLSTVIFNKLTNGTYEDYTLDLPSEVAFVLTTGAKAISIMGNETDVNNLSTEQQMQLCGLIKELNNSDLIMNLLPIGASVALSNQALKDAIKEKLPGLEETLTPGLLKDVDWNHDIIAISDTAMNLVKVSNGFQNLEKIDPFDLNTDDVKVLMKSLSSINVLLTVLPVVVDAVCELPQVKDQIADLGEELKDIVWSSEIENVGVIYEKFHALGLKNFDNIFGDLTANTDQLDYTEDLVGTMFDSMFISKVFPLAFNKVVDGQPENIQQLFGDIHISEWENELKVVIQLAREVVEGGGSIEKLDLSIVKDVNVDTILKSDLLTQGFTQIFITAEDPGSVGQSIGLDQYIYVPKDKRDVSNLENNPWYKKAEPIKDENGDITGYKPIEHKELANILTAFQKILSGVEGEINFENIPDYILAIDDKYLQNDDNSIFTSEVLRASISKLVETNEEIKNTITIPLNATDALDDMRCIKKEELNKMIMGVKALGITEFENIQPNKAMIENLNAKYESEVVTGDLTNLDVILSSQIVHSTFSQILSNLGEQTNGTLTIPADATKNTTLVDGSTHKDVKKDEIQNIVDALLVFDINYEAPEFTVDMVTNLTDDEAKTVSKSKILRQTITNVLAPLDADNTLVVPDSALNEFGYVHETELQNMIKGVKALGITDFTNITPEQQNLIIENLNKLKDENKPHDSINNPKNVEIVLNSNIVHATVSKFLNEAAGPESPIKIPVEVVDNSHESINKKPVTLIKDLELIHIVEAVNVIDIDFANPQFNVSMITKLSDDDVIVLGNSLIIKNTLTFTLKDLDTQNTLVFPSSALEGDYIKVSEIQNMIHGINALGVKDITNITDQEKKDLIKHLNLAKDPDSVVSQDNPKNITTVLSSKIVHATVSKYITDATLNSPIKIPTEVLGSTSTVNNNTVQVVIDSELENIVAAVNVIDIDFTNPQFDVSMITSLNDGEVKTLSDSLIIRFTITDTLIGLDADNTIVFPTTALEGKFIKVSELQNMIHGINSLGVKDITHITEQEKKDLVANLNKTKDPSQPESITNPKNITTVLSSNIVHATVSKYITDAAGEASPLKIPTEVIKNLKSVNNKDVKLVTDIELKHIVEAVNIIDIDITNPQFEVSMITSLNDGEVKTLSDSLIIRFTITDTLIGLDKDGTLIFPTKAMDGKYIKVSELQNMIKGINSLGVKDITHITEEEKKNLISNLNMTKDSSKPESVTNPKNITVVLSSNIVHATVSKYVTEAAKPGSALHIPDEVLAPIKTVNEVNLNIVTSEELQHVVGAVGVINIDITNPKFSVNDLLELTNDDIDTLGLSKIILDTMTMTLKDLDNSGTIIVPLTAKSGNYIAVSEIKAMIKGVKSLGITDFENITKEQQTNIIKHLDKLVDETKPESKDNPKNVEVILKSKIVHATVSKFINDIGGTQIIIPNEILDKTGKSLNNNPLTIVSSEELRNVVSAVNIINIDFANPTFSPDILLDLYYKKDDAGNKLGFDETLGNNNVTNIANSKIINATLTNALLDLGSEAKATLVIPNNAEVITKPNDTYYVVPLELQRMIKGIISLGITDFANVTIDETLVKGLEDKSLISGYSKIQVVLQSQIVHATLSKAINDIVAQSNGQLIIPLLTSGTHHTIDKIDIYDDVNKFNIITSEEIIDMIHAFNLLNIKFTSGSTDFDASVIFNLPSEDVEALVKSNIINLTLANNLIKIGTTGGVLLLPKDSFDLIETYKFIKPVQVTSLIDGFNILLKEDGKNVDLNNINITSEKLGSLTTDQIKTLLGSDIVKATISDKILKTFDNPSSIVVIPSEIKEPVQVTLIDDSKISVINNTDITQLFKAFSVLTISLDKPEFDVNTILSYNNDELFTLATSKIINATITKQLLDIASRSGSLIAIPKLVIINNLYMQNDEKDPSKRELVNMINGVKALGVTNFNNITPSHNMFKSLNDLYDPKQSPTETKLDVALRSEIVKATISYILIDAANNSKGTIIIPERIKDPAIDLVNNVKFKNVKEAELTNLIKGLGYFEINFSGETNISPKSLFVLLDPVDTTSTTTKLDVVLSSDILHATFSDKLLKITIFNVVNDKAIYETIDGNKYMNKSEIANLLKGLQVFVGKDTESFSSIKITPSVLFGDNLDVILNSLLLQSTISQNITSVELLNKPVTDNLYVTEFEKAHSIISKKEIKQISKGLELLNITDDFANITFTPNILFNLLEADTVNGGLKIDTLLNSIIMHATVSDQIKKIPLDKPVMVNIYDPVYGSQNIILKDEIKNLLVGLQLIVGNASDFNISFDVNNIFSLLKDPIKVDNLFKSSILHLTISNKISAINDLVIIDKLIDKNKDNIIYKEHIVSLLNSLDSLGYSSGFTFGLDIFKGKDLASLKELFDSVILRATISKTGNLASMGIPNSALDTLYNPNNLNVKILTVDEMANLVNGLTNLGMLDFDINNIANGLTPEKVEVACQSVILHQKISSIITNNEAFSIDINATENGIVKVNEIKALVACLGGQSLDTYTVNQDTAFEVLNNKSKIVILKDSLIMRSTLGPYLTYFQPYNTQNITLIDGTIGTGIKDSFFPKA